MNIIDIKSKEKELLKISELLKQDFVGLDKEIDKIIENIKIWYMMPEILSSPIIINLWGMTGTGKTDLVRKLSKYLGFADKLFEIQMDSDIKSGHTYHKTIKEALDHSDLTEDDRGIILLDEFQRFRTIDNSGSDKDVERFADVWMLLSDGVFNTGVSNRRSDLEEEIFSLYNSIKHNLDAEDDYLYNAPKSKLKFSERPIGRYYAKKFKKIARLPLSISELACKKNKEIVSILESKLDDPELYQGDNYKKSLIFICGNIDSAYDMSKSVADADENADILHKHSQNINIVTIKKALARMFKPEQIARLGSNHIIYPCLSASNYRLIIEKKLNEFLKQIKETIEIECIYKESLVSLLYSNFVYPSQGVRPVFSGINSFLSKVFPEIIFKHLELNNSGKIEIYGDDNCHIYFVESQKKFTIDYFFDLSCIKNKISFDKKVGFAVHEAGHALVYSILFGYAPKFINIELSSFNGAFVVPNSIFSTKQSQLNLITILFAGMEAEEIVFGGINRSLGCGSDMEEATKHASQMIRMYGFGSFNSTFTSESSANADESNVNLNSTNEEIEQILKLCRVNASLILNQNRKLLKKIADKLLEVNKMNGDEYCKLLKSDLPNLKYIDPLDLEISDEIIVDYKSQYEKFEI